jgi:hypothetical protein
MRNATEILTLNPQSDLVVDRINSAFRIPHSFPAETKFIDPQPFDTEFERGWRKS